MDIPTPISTPTISKPFSPPVSPMRRVSPGSFSGMSRPPKKAFDWFGTLSFIIFFGVVCWWASLYGYQYLLNQEKDKIQKEISDLAKGFELATIDKLEVLGNRLSFAQRIINNHNSLLPLFCFLEENTLTKTISYESFVYDAGDIQSGENRVILKGKADSFASLAYQEEVFNKKEKFSKLSFSNLSVSELDGGIDFTTNINVGQELISYKGGMPDTCATSSTP